VLAGVIERLRGDSALPDSLRGLTVNDLLSPANTNYAGFLDDSSAQLYMQATAALTHQIPPERCGKLLDPGPSDGTDLDLMLSYADSGSVAIWAIVLERIVHARAAGQPAGRIATPTEVQGLMLTAMGRLRPEDRTRLNTIARNPPPTPADACWSVQQIMVSLAALPPPDLGPVMRALFGKAIAR
jgi:hypothetical protein